MNTLDDLDKNFKILNQSRKQIENLNKKIIQEELNENMVNKMTGISLSSRSKLQNKRSVLMEHFIFKLNETYFLIEYLKKHNIEHELINQVNAVYFDEEIEL